MPFLHATLALLHQFLALPGLESGLSKWRVPVALDVAERFILTATYLLGSDCLHCDFHLLTIVMTIFFTIFVREELRVDVPHLIFRGFGREMKLEDGRCRMEGIFT